jgi:hypothetical protein
LDSSALNRNSGNPTSPGFSSSRTRSQAFAYLQRKSQTAVPKLRHAATLPQLQPLTLARPWIQVTPNSNSESPPLSERLRSQHTQSNAFNNSNAARRSIAEEKDPKQRSPPSPRRQMWPVRTYFTLQAPLASPAVAIDTTPRSKSLSSLPRRNNNNQQRCTSYRWGLLGLNVFLL